METRATGELVQVGGDGPARDGIVFDLPSRSKVVVAMILPGRGPGFRTVPADAVSGRATEGPDDLALRQLIRRTPPPGRTAAHGGAGAGRGAAGFTRGTSHRPTGR